jgi:hypothetical protein
MPKLLITATVLGAFSVIGLAPLPSIAATNTSTNSISAGTAPHNQIAKRHKRGGKKPMSKKPPKGPPPRR